MKQLTANESKNETWKTFWFEKKKKKCAKKSESESARDKENGPNHVNVRNEWQKWLVKWKKKRELNKMRLSH